MIRLLASVSLLMYLSLAAAQPIEDYTVVCRVEVVEDEVDTDDTTSADDGETSAIEVVEEEDGDEVIGVASNVDGTWHVSLDRDASCDGAVVLVPYGDGEDAELDATIATDEDGSTTLAITEPVESDVDGDTTTVEGDTVDETTGEPTEVEPTEVEAVEVPAVAIEGKRRARENRNAAWDGRPGRPDWAGGDDEEEGDAEEPGEEPLDETDPPELADADEVAGERDEHPGRRGPPDVAGPPNGDDDEGEDDEDLGPPEGRGGPPVDGAGPPDARGKR